MSNLIASTTSIDAMTSLLAINKYAEDWALGKRGVGAARGVVGISRNDKMPSYTLAIPAREACPRGGVLAKIEGTVCHGCYAVKGHDAMSTPIAAKARRWDVLKLALVNDSVRSIYKDAFIIALAKEDYFRWHSAGDLFSIEYAYFVKELIEATHHVKHWIPTREAKTARIFDNVPNAIARVSDDMVDQSSNHKGALTSGVHTTLSPTRGVVCNAPKQGGKCLDCRACWSKEVKHISYHLH